MQRKGEYLQHIPSNCSTQKLEVRPASTVRDGMVLPSGIQQSRADLQLCQFRTAAYLTRSQKQSRIYLFLWGLIFLNYPARRAALTDPIVLSYGVSRRAKLPIMSLILTGNKSVVAEAWSSCWSTSNDKDLVWPKKYFPGRHFPQIRMPHEQFN